MRTMLLTVLAVAVGVAGASGAETNAFCAGKWLLCADYTAGKVALVKPDGAVAWQQPGASCNDLWMLPGGNVLHTTGHGVREVTRAGEVVFKYDTKSEVYACQRLANGNTFVGECNGGRLLEVAPDGQIVKQVALLPEGQDGGHVYMRNARRLPDGHFLVTHYGAQVVREYDADGKQVWEAAAPGGPHSAVRLPNGNTLFATGDRTQDARLTEVDRAGQVVWCLSNKDLPGAPLRFLTGFHRLPNGNTLISNWLGHGQFGKAPHLLEITPAKQVVWSFADHAAFRTISSVQVLDAEGGLLPGPLVH